MSSAKKILIDDTTVHYAKAKEEATLMQLISRTPNFSVSISNSDFICEETPFVKSKIIGDLSRIEMSPFYSPSAINAKGVE